MAKRQPPVEIKAEVDEEALRRLLNTDGESFDDWVSKTRPMRREYADEIRKGYPARPEQAGAMSAVWEGWLGYAQEQAEVAKAFHLRAVAVAKEVLMARGHKDELTAKSNARTWQQLEEAGRWRAIADTLREWLWESRGREKQLTRPGGPGTGNHRS